MKRSSLLKMAATPQNLNSAWKKSRYDRAVWGPGVTRWEMEPDAVYHLMKLSDDLATGQYQPDPVRSFLMNKGDGKQRLISAYTLRDKVAQRAVLSVLEPIGEHLFHPDSFGYRPGRSVEMALARVLEYLVFDMVWIVDADILDCFDTIPHNVLIRIMESLIPDRELIFLIMNWVHAGMVSRGNANGKGIPQGAVISPFLCNLCLSWWDYSMASKNIPFVRFADDFLAFATSEEKGYRAYCHAAGYLRRLGLELNPEKTRVVRCGPHVRFLGQDLPRV